METNRSFSSAERYLPCSNGVPILEGEKPRGPAGHDRVSVQKFKSPPRQMETVSSEMWGVISHVLWREQGKCLATEDGKKYREELITLIDKLKEDLGTERTSAAQS